MKNSIILVLIVIGALNFYEKIIKTENNGPSPLSPLIEDEPRYECDGRQHCSQMGSYEEAKFFLENCPDTKMDGDYDGIPCEKQFGY